MRKYFVSTEKKKAKYAFAIYLIALADLVIFKFFGNVQSVVDTVQETIEERNQGYWNFSLIPFRTIRSSLYSKANILQFSLLANIIVFIPMGFFIAYLL